MHKLLQSNKNTMNVTNKSQEVSPFPTGDHKQWTDAKAWETQDAKTQKIHKRSTALERSVKICYLRA